MDYQFLSQTMLFSGDSPEMFRLKVMMSGEITVY